ncbi:MAG: hypothetical protein NPINA01_17730 [Nitrospinaceae bacterium]|nr:MAG: hypothetical protein NPINA01_17730 [Nitrospinaceae bacterium]
MAEPLLEKLFIHILDLLDCHCQNTAKLVSESMDHRISITKRWRIKFHLALCKYCRQIKYQEQLQTIRSLAKGLKEKDLEIDDDTQLKTSSKERMKRLVDGEK